MGFTLHEKDADTCEMHHVRCPDDEHFIYDPRVQPLNDTVLWGRCEIIEMDEAKKERVETVLKAYGMDQDNIPIMGTGNCQNWVAGAAAALEKDSLLRDGEADFWLSQINISGDAIAANCRQSGRKWVEGLKLDIDPALIYARFNDKEHRTIGKIGEDESFKSTQDQLHAALAQRASSTEKVERPYYISSRFFPPAATSV